MTGGKEKKEVANHLSTQDIKMNMNMSLVPDLSVLAYPVQANPPHRHQSFIQLASFPITLKFEEVVYKVNLGQKEKTILNGVTGLVCPGEILAMLGPSGSGKTTLLTALGGRLRGNLYGKFSYNGQGFSGSVKRRTGFVAQDDVLYPHLTVTETLYYTALLRLPESLMRGEKLRHVESIIAELGLDKCRNSMIGGPLFRGISGGEKKRVSIGQEMLINPSLLLLDEPTSGLDSTTAQRIMMTIKLLAGGGRTVVTTIHQPSSRLYHMFNKVLLLSEGSPIYYGAASSALDYFSSIGFPTSVIVNPADILLDLANGIGPDSKQGFDGCENMREEKKMVRECLLTCYEKNISTRLKSEAFCSVEMGVPPPYNFIRGHELRSEQWCNSWWHQFKVLLQRGLKERRFESFNRLRIFQVISVALLGGLLWWHTPQSHIADRIALLFFFSMFWGFYPLYNAVFTFPQESRILLKERSSGMYRLSSYFLARTIGDLPLELALPTVFTFILYWMGGLKPDPVSFLLSLIVILYSVLVSQGLGLAFGAILMEVKQATTLASVTTMVFLIAGGYYVQQIPPFIAWLKYLSYSYYCYRLLLGIQYREDDYYECSQGLCRVGDFPTVKAVGLHHLWVDVFIMACMLVGYRIVAYFALRRVLR